MGDLSTLKAAVAAAIRTNGNQEITGQVLQNTLTSIINTLGTGAQYMGIATPSTNPGTPDAKVFYIASANGTYSNFGGITVNNEVVILVNSSGSWVKQTTGFATIDGLNNIIEKIGTLASLSTEEKSNLVAAINEVVAKLATLINNVGELANLTTEEKSNLVAAINENKDKIATLGAKVNGQVTKQFSKGISGEFFEYKFKKGLKYTIKNTSASGYFDAWIAFDNTTIPPTGQKFSQIIFNQSVSLVAESDANYLRVGSCNGTLPSIVTFEVTEEYEDSIPNQIKKVKDNVENLSEKVEGASASFTKSGTSGAFFAFDIKQGKKYKLSNTSASGYFDAWIAFDNTTIPPTGQKIASTLLFGQSVEFVAESNAPYIRIGSTSSATTTIEIADVESIDARIKILDSEVEKDAKALKDLTNRIGETLEGTIEDTSSWIEFAFVKGHEYRLTNTSAAGVFNAYTATSKDTSAKVDDIANQLVYGNSARFIASNDASYLRISGTKSPNSYVVEDLTSLVGRISVLEKEIGVEIPLDPHIYGVGTINRYDGGVTPNTSGFARYVKIDVDGKNYKKISFIINQQGDNSGFGFFVGSTWVSMRKQPSGTNETVTLDIPEGATEFRTWWNVSVVPSQKIVVSKSFEYADVESAINKGIHTDLAFQFTPDFSLSRVPEQEAIVRTTNVNKFYGLYNGLRDTYPKYIERIACDDIASTLGITRPAYLDGLPIMMYHFKPTRSRHANGDVDYGNRVKVMIVTGTHPDEWYNMFCTFRMMKMICENWKNDINAELVRSLIDIYVIPCLSPWGFEHQSRINGNGVNLNRNFPTQNWTIGSASPGTADYGGTMGGSEYETQILMYYVNQIKPDVFIDGHTPRMPEYGIRGAFLIEESNPIKDLANVIVRTTSNQYIKENSDYPDDIDKALFDVDFIIKGGAYNAFGEEYQWVHEQGYGLACLLEGAESSRWKNGVLNSDEQELDTPRIARENIQYYWNTLLRLTYAACRKFY